MSRPSPSSAPPSASSCRDPRVQSSPRSRAACCVRTSLSTWPGILGIFSVNTWQLLLDDRVSNVGRHFHVLFEFHGEGRTTLTHGTNRGGITKHFGQGHFAGDDFARRPLVHTCDLPAAAVQVADDIT